MGKSWLPEWEKKAYQQTKAQQQQREAKKPILKALGCIGEQNHGITLQEGLPTGKHGVCSQEPSIPVVLEDAAQFRLFA